MKLKTHFVCAECGAVHPRWEGKCRECGAWNTLAEETVTAVPPSGKRVTPTNDALPLTVADATTLVERPLARLTTAIAEFDRVVGGGLVPGSFTLLGGEPGIGKSTLTLAVAAAFAKKGTVLLASGEESAEQIALRARRMHCATTTLKLVSTTDLDAILATAEHEQPTLLIVDSVQVVTTTGCGSVAGGIAQIRAVAEALLRFAKTTATPVILIGHVTKDGELAGPRVLEHLVDTVLTLEGDRYHDLRILRTAKNRFGATSEVGVFEMVEHGLKEITNPSAVFLAGRTAQPIGSVVTAALEGTRPLLVEVQALTSPMAANFPRRTASGFDANRLHLLAAVLNRHAGLKLDTTDIFVNVVGGLRLSEPAADLAVCLAIASSKAQIALPADLATWGEVGLTGEIRTVSQHDRRTREAAKLGFKKIISETTIAAALKKWLR